MERYHLLPAEQYIGKVSDLLTAGVAKAQVYAFQMGAMPLTRRLWFQV